MTKQNDTTPTEPNDDAGSADATSRGTKPSVTEGAGGAHVATGDAGDAGAAAPDEAALFPRWTEPTDLWTNGRWAVTEVGLESRYVAASGLRIDYVIERERLLQVQHDTENVSRWGPHVAEKSWVDDADAFIEALGEALRIHHPGQTTIDFDATADEACRKWERFHSTPAAVDDLCWEYVLGEGMRRLERSPPKVEVDGDEPAGARAAEKVPEDELSPSALDHEANEEIEDAIDRRHRDSDDDRK